ncbi:signal recognition particle subunit FFH/SRP54 (srp54) [Desulfonispora thiosulfatigenes DSM 11270]|uniref:Signal recognition particle protein n=1 Tax=Desulfonispora thiosulfatigenes DSM 11270 TaxID=656914 RepID=A0A1W1VKG3_DESTI|nr:signal recognition particle protein [Desulfonispora thiosulfatigenes]SMB93783.1 signal recognition particle subunit FFH/SRP54 (srp54) [Desulfonispora thiosulfatigenes DSM 11270]
MAFEGLGEKLQGVFKKLKGKGKISETDLKAALREVRVALLEADVNYKVVKNFINNINDRAVGQEVLESLTPGQQVVKIVNDELTSLMGGETSKLNMSSKPPTVIMMVGLQGSGKTTSTGKLSNYLKKQGRRPLLVACDIYRPAAIKQLQVLGEQLEMPVFSMGDKTNPVEIAKSALDHAMHYGNDVVLIDTAGRLHIDEELMEELVKVKKIVNPTEILLVVDAMTGQDAVNVAERFNELLDITGVVLTKLDGDTRGGAALSVKAVTGKPIKFVGMGEKLDALEPFHPDRMSSRILGMGDVLTLIEKAQEGFDEQKAKEMELKLKKAEFTLEDFLDQMQEMKKMGPLDQVMEMLPGMNKGKLKGLQLDEKEFDRARAIIQSMTLEERRKPSLINGSRRKRIAAGSGSKVQEVNRILKQFDQTQKLMKQFSGMSKSKKAKFKLPFM